MPKKANGEGSVTRHGDGWRLRWTAPDGTRKTKVIPKMSEKAARAQLREFQVLGMPEPASRSRRFREFTVDYLAFREKDWQLTTYGNAVSIMNAHLLRAFGDLPLDRITQRRVDMWWASMADHQVQRRNCFFTLQKAMKTAKRWGEIPTWDVEIENAGKDVSVPRPTWSLADFDRVLRHVAPFYVAPLEVMFGAHLRVGELVALNGSDYKDGAVSVTKQRTARGLTTDTKYGEHGVTGLLERGRRALDSHPRVIGSAPLFAGERGPRITRLALRNAWMKAVAAEGLEDFHLHDIRHIGLTLVAEVAPMKVVQERARHRSSTSTQRYLHTDARVHDEAVAKVDELIRRIS